MEVTILCNLISEVVSHILCCILLIIDESLTSAHTQGRGLYKGVNTRRGASWEAILETAHHTCIQILILSLIVGPQVRNPISLSFGFLLCEVGVIMPNLQGCDEDER